MIESNLLSMLEEKDSSPSVKPRFQTPMRHAYLLNNKHEIGAL